MDKLMTAGHAPLAAHCNRIAVKLSPPSVNAVNIGGDYEIRRSVHHSVRVCVRDD